MKIDYVHMAELCECQMYDTVIIIISVNVNVRCCHVVKY